LLGWATGSQRLVQLASGCPSMKPAAATCFILLGTALAGRVTRPWPARADLIAATAAGAVVVLALLEYATGRDVGVDRFPSPPGSPEAVRAAASRWRRGWRSSCS
jgi:hypothetical protein